MSIPLLSFFTGGGFLDLGFALAGFEIVWTNESNNVFAHMYEFAASSFNTPCNAGKMLPSISDRRSIENISAGEIVKAAFPGGRPGLFGIIGGPPCPDFSNGGKHKGHEGDQGRLSKTYVDRICSIKPSFFVLENVHGLIGRKKHRAFLETLEKQLEGTGYCLDRNLLNSLDFGLAQDRARVFLIGVRQGLLEACLGKRIEISEREWFPWPKIEQHHDAKKRFIWPDVTEQGEVPVRPDEIPEELMVVYLLSNIPDDLPNAKEGFKPYSKKFKTVREGDTTGKSFKRLHRYRYSPTACYGNNEVHLHPWENRRLTVRETMRIQGIPDGYSLPETVPLTAKFKMVANGVPIPLAEQIAFSLRRFLKPLVKRRKLLGRS